MGKYFECFPAVGYFHFYWVKSYLYHKAGDILSLTVNAIISEDVVWQGAGWGNVLVILVNLECIAIGQDWVKSNPGN